MSTSVVIPPAAAAAVAVANPSQWVRPGSSTWTWLSTRPGSSTSSSARSTTVAPAGTGASTPATSVIRPSVTTTTAGTVPVGRTVRRARTARGAAGGIAWRD